MNEQQKRALEIAVEGHNLLLLGPAGSGKSFVVKEIAKQLQKNGKKVKITCSTGIACQVYDTACTINQFTGIYDGRYGPNEIIDVLKNNRKYDIILSNVMNCDVIVVDECSMISSRTFEILSKVFSLKNSKLLFGGIQVIFAGDFYQLPPVPNSRYDDSGAYCFEHALFQSLFPHRVVLSNNMRQNEQPFIKVINEVFSGTLTPASEMFIKDLSRPLTHDHSHKSLKLFSRNDLTDDFNRKSILEHPGQVIEFISTDSGNIQELKTISAPKILWLKIGIPVILLTNLDSKLVNGLQGIVEYVDNEAPVIKFPSIGISRRITKVKFTVFSPKLGTDVAVREQYPLKPAFGMTIHKAQGMTLSRVEIDCRDIFKTGQLGVALSRASSYKSLRVINFHRRYVIHPTIKVTEFMQEKLPENCQPDLSCCRNSCRFEELPVDLLQQSLHASKQQDDISFDEELDEEINEILVSISLEEEESQQIYLPEDLFINLEQMKYSREITDFQKQHNQLLSEIDEGHLNDFVKKVYLKLEGFQKHMQVDETEPKAIPEKKLAEFYSKVHTYSTSSEYIFNCLILFESEDLFCAVHQGICYNILEVVRKYFIKQKAALFHLSQRTICKRNVTDASKARVRYVAGYCIATLRRKYFQTKLSNMYSHSEDGQNKYENAKSALSILNALKEEEQFIHNNTSEPDSLLDIDRRQYVSRGLTNVSDSVFHFFLTLTEKCLKLLVNDNFLKHGHAMYEKSLCDIKSDCGLFETFSSIAVRQCTETREELNTAEDLDMSTFLQDMTLQVAILLQVYNEILAKYLLVLFAQFRKDMKSCLKVEKTMAHRKQIKMSKSNELKKSAPELKSTVTEEIAGPSTSSTTTLSEQSASAEQSEEQSLELSGSVSCRECKLDHDNDEWIMCDMCESWIHRICSGLTNKYKWKTVSKGGIQWNCKYCLPAENVKSKWGKRKKKVNKYMSFCQSVPMKIFFRIIKLFYNIDYQ